MRKKVAAIFLIALIVPLGLAQVPRWAVGKFKGSHDGSAITISVTNQGDVFYTSSKNGKSVEREGRISGGIMTVGPTRYNIEETRDGFRAYSSTNGKERISFIRIGGSIGEDIGRPQRPPSWAVGKFSGYNKKYDSDMTVTVSQDGNATAIVRPRKGGTQTQRGSWNGTYLTLDGIKFNVREESRGISLRQIDDITNTTVLKEGTGGSTDETVDVPSWSVGEFTGYNLRYDSDNTLTVDSRGRAVCEIRFRTGRRQTQTGQVNLNRLILEGIGFAISKSGSGMRVEQLGDRNNWMEYSRGGSGGDRDKVAPPSWAVGSFDAHNRLYDTENDLTIERDGSVRVRIRFKDGRRQSQTGHYERGDKVIIDGIRFSISSTRRGVRLVQDSERENDCEYVRY